MLMHAEVIDEADMSSDVVRLGNIVTILDLSEENAEEESYKIVGTTEADPLNGKLSNVSLVGQQKLFLIMLLVMLLLLRLLAHMM